MYRRCQRLMAHHLHCLIKLPLFKLPLFIRIFFLETLLLKATEVSQWSFQLVERKRNASLHSADRIKKKVISGKGEETEREGGELPARGS